MEKVFLKIMRQLNYPPIFLIPPKQFEMIEGEEKKEDNAVGDQVFGIAAIDYPVIAVRDDIGGKTLLNVLWHEVAHHLWPWRVAPPPLLRGNRLSFIFSNPPFNRTQHIGNILLHCQIVKSQDMKSHLLQVLLYLL